MGGGAHATQPGNEGRELREGKCLFIYLLGDGAGLIPIALGFWVPCHDTQSLFNSREAFSQGKVKHDNCSLVAIQ